MPVVVATASWLPSGENSISRTHPLPNRSIAPFGKSNSELS